MSTTTTPATTLPTSATTATATVTITDHRGALEHGEEPSTRTVTIAGLPADVAGHLAALALGWPPTAAAPTAGTYVDPQAGGRVVVTLTDDPLPSA